MKYAWKFDVANRPSKEKDGLTNVSQDFTLKGTVEGEIIPVGSIVKSRGNASYVALNMDGDRVGVFETRSKAAHALRKHRVANLVADATDAVVAATDADAAVEGEPVIVETDVVETTDVEEVTAEDIVGEAA